jgi:radical SAM protein with 4Fe4S-binding SPASM domain
MKEAILVILNKLPLGVIKKLKRLNPEILWNRLKFFFTGKVSLPSSIIIDPCNVCNLSCQLCPSGRKELPQKLCRMSFVQFKRIIDQIPGLSRISLFNWGESLLNPEINKMIRYAKEKDIFIAIHSNLSLVKDEQFFQELIGSGLDRLVISLDGASQEIYEKYRAGGDFSLVLKNLRDLVEIKKEMKMDSPKIIWKFIVNKHNKKELPKAKKMADEIGVDFEWTSFGLGDAMADYSFGEKIADLKKEWLPEEEKYIHDKYKGEYKLPLNNEPCPFLFSQPVIDPSGKVYSCCYLVNEQNSFGDLEKENFSEIWNNEDFSSARGLFASNLKKTPRKAVICEKCIAYKKHKA